MLLTYILFVIVSVLAASTNFTCRYNGGSSEIRVADTGGDGTPDGGGGTTDKATTTAEEVVPTSAPLVQYTPDQADWSELKNGKNHSPLESWPEWDNVVVDRIGLSHAELEAAACENNLVKGMYKAYPDPFADPMNPTKAEMDEYNVQVIRQVLLYLQHT
jgi:hypothetical protein